MEKPEITRECIKPLLETKYIKVYDLQYAPGRHYLDATRRSAENLMAVKTQQEFQQMLADAVTCYVIVKTPSQEPRLLLSYEFRYPAGQFLLSPPAGLIDPEDQKLEVQEALKKTAVREIKEETGIEVTPEDRVEIVSPLVLSTPGMTDESNALVLVVVSLPDLSELSQKGAVGSECFDGFSLLTKEEAEKILKTGRDPFGNFYSVYTWGALLYFVSGEWEKTESS